jgi:hypothetical protein
MVGMSPEWKSTIATMLTGRGHERARADVVLVQFPFAASSGTKVRSKKRKIKGFRAMSGISHSVPDTVPDTFDCPHETFPDRQSFEWQVGYGAFSISGMDDTIAYIKNQADHHKRLTFKDELQAILKEPGSSSKNGCSIDGSAAPAGAFDVGGTWTHC